MYDILNDLLIYWESGAPERGGQGAMPPTKRDGGKQYICPPPHKNGTNSIRNYEEIENILD